MKALIVCALAQEPIAAGESDHPRSDYSSCALGCALDFGLTIAVDGGAQWFKQQNSAPNFAVGDFDSIDADTLNWLTAHEKAAATQIQRVSDDKDFSDLELALALCEQHKVQSATIIGAVGGRIDHQLCVLGAVQNSTIQQLTLQETLRAGQAITLLRAGQTITLNGGQGADQTPSILAPTAGAQTFSLISLGGATVSIENARWPLDHITLQPLSAHGLSNQFLPGVSATVTVHKGSAFLIYTMTYEVHGNSTA